MKRSTRTIPLALLVILPASLFGQIDLNPELPDDIKAQSDAFEDIKSGDTAKGLAKLNAAAAAAPGLMKAELQTSRQLAIMCSWLHTVRHPRAKEIAAFTIAEITKGRTKFNAAESAQALATAGALYEDVIGSSADAKAIYEAALRLDPAQPEATAALQRMQTLDALLAVRTRENETIRQNSSNKK
jgi:hypothetical protein